MYTKKKNQKKVNLLLVRKDDPDPERSDKRSETDMGLEHFFLQRAYCFNSKTTLLKNTKQKSVKF